VGFGIGRGFIIAINIGEVGNIAIMGHIMGGFWWVLVVLVGFIIMQLGVLVLVGVLLYIYMQLILVKWEILRLLKRLRHLYLRPYRGVMCHINRRCECSYSVYGV
jgi:hypothetical protein